MSSSCSVVRLAIIGAILILSLQGSVVAGNGNEDRASASEWIYLGILLVGTVALLLVAVILGRRGVNPYTRRPSKIKRRRARGPLKGGDLT